MIATAAVRRAPVWDQLCGLCNWPRLPLQRLFASAPASSQGAEELLNSLINYEQQGIPANAGLASSANRFDLSRMHKLLHAMGNPQQQLKAVHIAGSKGACPWHARAHLGILYYRPHGHLSITPPIIHLGCVPSLRLSPAQQLQVQLPPGRPCFWQLTMPTCSSHLNHQHACLHGCRQGLYSCLPVPYPQCQRSQSRHVHQSTHASHHRANGHQRAPHSTG